MIFGTYNPGEAAEVLMRAREVAAVAARGKAGGEVRGEGCGEVGAPKWHGACADAPRRGRAPTYRDGHDLDDDLERRDP